ncbi:MAG: VWA domain-containing protein [Acidobacteria bacterium]|nr:MAG: VWA domain-containing protein [Acidobacteriota bacterium]
MRARNAFSLSGVALLATLVSAQGTEQDELPSAPSAAQQQSKPQAPATPPQTAPAPGEPASQEKASPTPTQPQTTLPAEQPATQSPKNESPKANDKTSSPETSEETAPTIFRTVNEVNVVFTVTDKHGRYVKDLKKNDFKVIDDTRPADEIRSFHNETDLPLQVGLLVDASNSVRDTPEVTQDFTDNTEFLSRGVRALRPGGGTALYDAIYYACRDKLLKAQQRGPVRRAIILLSDGADNQSHVSREEAIDMAQRAEVIVYTISTNIIGSRNKGDKILERIANATGGRPFFPFQITDVANAFAEIQDELRSQYALSYKPADLKADGRYHSIEILAQNHKNLRVRSRRGYYAPAQ